LRRDSPQALRSRHCRAGRPVLSSLIPGCSAAGDQGPSRFPVRGPVPRRCPECELAAPGAETFRAAPSGRWILAADGCASASSDPAYCFCAVWAPGGPRGVAVAMFGHTGLGMLISRIEGVADPDTYASTCKWLAVAQVGNSVLPFTRRARRLRAVGACAGCARTCGRSRVAGTRCR